MKVIYTKELQQQFVNLFTKVSLFLALLVFSSYSSLAQPSGDMAKAALTFTKSTDQGTTILIDPNASQPIFTPNIFNIKKTNPSNSDVKVTIYPNPFMEKVTFKKLNTEPVELKFKVMTQSNQFITSGTIASNEKEKSINLDYIPNGIYYVHFYTADGVTMQKIIKRK